MQNRPHLNNPPSYFIYKKNELIRGNLMGLSLHANKAMNGLYYHITKNGLEGQKSFTVPYSRLRKMMHLEKITSYVEIIDNALLELATTRLELRNYKSIADGREFYRFYLAFLSDFKVEKKHNAGKNIDQWIVEVRIYYEMRAMIQRAKTEGNWTQIEWFKYSNKFRSKFSLGLYEYLKSFKNDNNYIKIELIELNQIFGLIKANGNSQIKNRKEITKPKQLWEVLIIINRCVKEIVAKSDLKDLSYKAHKKTKSVIFYFIKPNLIGAKKVKNIVKELANRKTNIDGLGEVLIAPEQQDIFNNQEK